MMMPAGVLSHPQAGKRIRILDAHGMWHNGIIATPAGALISRRFIFSENDATIHKQPMEQNTPLIRHSFPNRERYLHRIRILV